MRLSDRWCPFHQKVEHQGGSPWAFFEMSKGTNIVAGSFLNQGEILRRVIGGWEFMIRKKRSCCFMNARWIRESFGRRCAFCRILFGGRL